MFMANRHKKSKLNIGPQPIKRPNHISMLKKVGSSSQLQLSGKQEDSSSDEFIKFDESGNILNDMTPEQRRIIEKVLKDNPFNELYNLALGLPSRIRSYIKKVRKRQRRCAEWDNISDEVAPIAAKILDHKVDIISFVGLAAIKSDGHANEARVNRMVTAMRESDALLTLYSSYFLCGITAELTRRCCLLVACSKGIHIIGGLADVINFGFYTSQKRSSRRLKAQNDIKEYGWKLPTKVDR
jgi:hypothetical protein